MGSRMKRLWILLFIGVTGILFLTQKVKDANQPPVNFIEEASKPKNFTEEEIEEGEREKREENSEFEEQTETREEKKAIFVHVCGAVKKEGVYELKEGSRVVDAIQIAGGLQKKASKKSVNQAEILEDGVQVYIPFLEEENRTSSEGENLKKVNINKASKEELMTLAGIGESRAEDIIRFRKENGKFKEISDIMKVNGIKQNAFDKIKDRITV